jgi:uncharacterized protein YjbI with pentapeptide repeats
MQSFRERAIFKVFLACLALTVGIFLLISTQIGLTSPPHFDPNSFILGERSFNFENGKCLRGIEPGFNEKKFGNCGDFKLTSLRKLNLTQFSLKGSRFQQTEFSRSKASRSSFQQANLRGAYMSISDFSESDFSQADLRGIKSYASIWRNANFSGANLSAAFFYHDILEGANFSGADMSGAILLVGSLKGSKFDLKTVLPFSRATALRLGMVALE